MIIFREEEVKDNRRSYLDGGMMMGDNQQDKTTMKRKEQASREIIAEISKKLKVSSPIVSHSPIAKREANQ